MHEIDIKEIIKTIGSLPPLPQITIKLIQMLNNPDTKVGDLVELIKMEQALTVDILKIVNSPYYGLRKEVISIRQAINYLGFVNLKSLIIALSTKKFMQKGDRYDLLLWKHSVSVALFSKLVTEKLNIYNTEEMFVAGLLHDIGKVVLNKNIPDTYKPIMDEVMRTGMNFEEIEKKVLGFTHSDVGLFLVQEWNLGERLKNVVFYHHNPPLASEYIQETAVVNLADKLSNYNEMGFYKNYDISSETPALNILNVTKDTLMEINDENIDKVREEMEVF
jgi:putative nucleotidyltransferase with HDIG domain